MTAILFLTICKGSLTQAATRYAHSDILSLAYGILHVGGCRCTIAVGCISVADEAGGAFVLVSHVRPCTIVFEVLRKGVSLVRDILLLAQGVVDVARSRICSAATTWLLRLFAIFCLANACRVGV
jgi:hypothetical protein